MLLGGADTLGEGGERVHNTLAVKEDEGRNRGGSDDVGKRP